MCSLASKSMGLYKKKVAPPPLHEGLNGAMADHALTARERDGARVLKGGRRWGVLPVTA